MRQGVLGSFTTTAARQWHLKWLGVTAMRLQCASRRHAQRRPLAPECIIPGICAFTLPHVELLIRWLVSLAAFSYFTDCRLRYDGQRSKPADTTSSHRRDSGLLESHAAPVP